MVKITCKNCGGQFDNTEAKCPYCDMIYEPGAESQYKENLEAIRLNLDVVDNAAEDDYKKDIKDFFKIFVPMIVTILCFTLVGMIATRVSTTGDVSVERTEMDKSIENVCKFHEVEKGWDAIYEAGDYEVLIEAVKTGKEGTDCCYPCK